MLWVHVSKFQAIVSYSMLVTSVYSLRPISHCFPLCPYMYKQMIK